MVWFLVHSAYSRLIHSNALEVCSSLYGPLVFSTVNYTITGIYQILTWCHMENLSQTAFSCIPTTNYWQLNVVLFQIGIIIFLNVLSLIIFAFFLYLYYISWFPNMYWYSLMDSRDFSGSLLVNPDVWMGFLIGIPGLKLWYNSNPFSFQASKENFKNMLTIIKKGKKYVQLKTKTTWTMLCLHAVLFFALTVQQLNKTAAAVH